MVLGHACLLLACALGAGPNAVPAHSLPLTFEPNVGQLGPGTLFLGRTGTLQTFVTPDALLLRIDACTRRLLRLELSGARWSPRLRHPLPGKVNYFIGRDPHAWRTDVPTYGQLLFPEAYPGVDLLLHGTPDRLEMDFTLRPGANPDLIRLDVHGADGVDTSRPEELGLRVEGRTVWLRRPRAFELATGRELATGYRRLPDGSIGFRIAPPAPGRAVLLDPVLDYSTFLNGSCANSYGNAIWIDPSGRAIVTGNTGAVDFPTVNPYQSAPDGGFDVFVSKFNTAGNGLLFSTFLGGSGDDFGLAVSGDSNLDPVVVGFTRSLNFPTVNPIVPPGDGGFDQAFISMLSPTGNALLFSTYFGTAQAYDAATGVTVDSTGEIDVAGWTVGALLKTVNAYQSSLAGSSDAFVLKLRGDGGILFSTYLGGFLDDRALAVASDGVGSVYLTGTTVSTDFPVLSAFQPAKDAGVDCFLAKFNRSGQLQYSTYLGGSGDDSCDGLGATWSSVAFVGGTTSSTNLPVRGAWQATYGGGAHDAFLARFGPAGQLEYLTYLGGSGDDQAYGVAVDPGVGEPYLTGSTTSLDFPLASPLQPQNGGGTDAFVTKLNDAGTGLIFSTYLGGTALDQANGIDSDGPTSVGLVGYTDSPNWPLKAPYQSTGPCGDTPFVVHISGLPAAAPRLLSVSPSSGPISGGTVVTVRGEGLLNTSRILFGTLPVLDAGFSAGAFTVVTPAHDGGLVDVAAVAPGVPAAILAGAFTYVAPDAGAARGGAGSFQVGCSCSDVPEPGFLALLAGVLLLLRTSRRQPG